MRPSVNEFFGMLKSFWVGKNVNKSKTVTENSVVGRFDVLGVKILSIIQKISFVICQKSKKIA